MTKYYVSNSGKNSNPGNSIDKPFRTITKGVSVLKPGDTLYLREGIYVESVNIKGLHGKSNAPIIIRSYPDELAYIDGTLTQFRTPNNNNWQLASLEDQDAHADEYVSMETFTSDPVNRGAFLDYYPYTRLITYSNLNDFRSDNETFDKLIDYPTYDPREGPGVMEKCSENKPDAECEIFQDSKKYKPALVQVKCETDDTDPNCVGKPGKEKYKWVQYRYPWVYMGPGLWFNQDTHRIHIRLSHTGNNIPDLADYTGETDPNKIGLAISPKSMDTLQVINSEHVHFIDISIRFGGNRTIALKGVKGLVFDHVQIWASRYGVVMGGDSSNPAKDTVFRNCEFDGGLPTWYFRTDRKAGYFFVSGGKIVENSLGKGTLDSLIIGNPNDIGTTISYCEFHDAHDLYLYGAKLTFEHNWIHNMNDEGIFLDAGTVDQPQTYQMKIYQNVITKTLSAISFAGNHPKGNWYIYRNLIDLRSPTGGHRPRQNGDIDIWRYGHLLKSIPPDGPRDLFQNTFLVYAQHGDASYLHYSNASNNQPRRTFNNIFIAVNPDPASDKPIAFLPPPSFPGPTDGNDYFRIGLATKPLFSYLKYNFDGDPACPGTDHKCSGGVFSNLSALRGNPAQKPSLLFIQSKSQYPPGYEAHSIEENPCFFSIGVDGVYRETDDLRLSLGSPAIGAGIKLPPKLRTMDPLATSTGKPDIGCYPFGSEPLEVGVDGRRSYPKKVL